MNVEDAVTCLVAELRLDAGFYASWKANIAMFVWDAICREGFKDEGRRLHKACNAGAQEFLNVLMRKGAE